MRVSGGVCSPQQASKVVLGFSGTVEHTILTTLSYFTPPNEPHKPNYGDGSAALLLAPVGDDVSGLLAPETPLEAIGGNLALALRQLELPAALAVLGEGLVLSACRSSTTRMKRQSAPAARPSHARICATVPPGPSHNSCGGRPSISYLNTTACRRLSS